MKKIIAFSILALFVAFGTSACHAARAGFQVFLWDLELCSSGPWDCTR